MDCSGPCAIKEKDVVIQARVSKIGNGGCREMKELERYLGGRTDQMVAGRERMIRDCKDGSLQRR